ncbi:MAG: DUF2235 domain-containing protein [Desulfobulbaceae bacterium]|nr:DUF2235 domain-containing protein [Desulfobulbaceae bacterium]HIJ91282.1 DUF2235 domain-containing protein [Deltaproteobacteria bacterium]
MKRLIVCCDGTWNNPDQEDNGIPAPTNVFKIYNAIADRDSNQLEQLKYYHPGVGGEGGIVDSIIGGAVGAGISRNICSAYHWLGSNYAEGDEIYLFGFSRGAFTARSLGGFLGRGLLDLQGVEPADSWARVKLAYEKGYRIKAAERADWAQNSWNFFHQGAATPIHFLGVWDTVGALGIPDDLEIFNFFDDPSKWGFHDTSLGKHVTTARHAMAIDEVRSCFSITRWSDPDKHNDAVECWFPGVHCDVGGGYSDCALANGALLWMMEQSEAKGLMFRESIKETIKADPLGVMHNSHKGIFAKFRSRPRNIPAMVEQNKAHFHQSALERQKVSPISYPSYHPTKILAPGESHTVDIFANTHWNYTGIYLQHDRSYAFSATGQWQDSKDSCDWKGTEDGILTTGDIVRATSSFLGTFEGIFKKLSKNSSTDFLGTKRVESMKWFTMVGAIANDAGSSAGMAVGNDGSAVPHQYVDLVAHETAPLKVQSPGYLYCFPNDVWSLYGNNRGSVRLTIRCVD